MAVNIYIDVIFLVNFGMDFFVLFLMKQMFKKRTTWLRLLGGSMTGAAWGAVSVLVSPPEIVRLAVTWLVIPGIMVRLAFGADSVRNHLKDLTELLIAAAAAGGILLILKEQLRTGTYIKKMVKARQIETVPVMILALETIGVYFFIRSLWTGVWKRKNMENHLYHVTLSYRGQEKRVTAFVDTGNFLRDPATKQPVHVISRAAGLELCKTVSSVIYVPFRTVGDQGVMPAVFLDYMDVEQGEKKIRVDRPLVAVSTRALSSSDEYQMLLNEEIGL